MLVTFREGVVASVPVSPSEGDVAFVLISPMKGGVAPDSHAYTDVWVIFTRN